MEEKDSKALGDILGGLLIAGVVAGALAVGPYALYVGAPNRFVPSSDPAVWGALGDYIGGVLGPAFSLFALIGVLISVNLQARQLKLAKHQAHLDEMQRLMATLAARIDSFLSAPPGVCSEPLRCEGIDVATRWELIAALGSDLTTEEARSESEVAWHQARQERLGRHAEREFMPMCLELEGLAWCLLKYGAAQGSELVLGFYLQRYGAEVAWLRSVGLLENMASVHEFFAPDKLRADLARLSRAGTRTASA